MKHVSCAFINFSYDIDSMVIVSFYIFFSFEKTWLLKMKTLSPQWILYKYGMVRSPILIIQDNENQNWMRRVQYCFSESHIINIGRRPSNNCYIITWHHSLCAPVTSLWLRARAMWWWIQYHFWWIQDHLLYIGLSHGTNGAIWLADHNQFIILMYNVLKYDFHIP